MAGFGWMNAFNSFLLFPPFSCRFSSPAAICSTFNEFSFLKKVWLEYKNTQQTTFGLASFFSSWQWKQQEVYCQLNALKVHANGTKITLCNKAEVFFIVGRKNLLNQLQKVTKLFNFFHKISPQVRRTRLTNLLHEKCSTEFQ